MGHASWADQAFGVLPQPEASLPGTCEAHASDTHSALPTLKALPELRSVSAPLLQRLEKLQERIRRSFAKSTVELASLPGKLKRKPEVGGAGAWSQEDAKKQAMVDPGEEIFAICSDDDEALFHWQEDFDIEQACVHSIDELFLELEQEVAILSIAAEDAESSPGSIQSEEVSEGLEAYMADRIAGGGLDEAVVKKFWGEGQGYDGAGHLHVAKPAAPSHEPELHASSVSSAFPPDHSVAESGKCCGHVDSRLTLKACMGGA